MLTKPLWTEGLLVSQHHFQQQDRYHEGLLHERLGGIQRHGWGVLGLDIDTTALESGHFRLVHLHAIWPDGAVLRCGEGTDEPAPEPRAFEEQFTADLEVLPVMAGIARESDTTGNAGSAEDSTGKRYVASSRSVADANTGGARQDLDWARPNVRLFFGSERTEGFTVVRIAELVRSKTGQVKLREAYVPPTLDAASSVFLHSGLRRVTNAVATRQRELASDRRFRQAEHVEFHSADARRFWLLHSLNGALPVLSHLLDAPRLHPEQIYLELVRLVGQLCTFDAEADPASLAKFNFLDLGGTFESLSTKVLGLLAGGIEQRYVEIPMEHRPDGMFIGKFPDPKLSGDELFVAVKSSVAEALVRERIPIVLKIASWGQIYDVVKHARHGVRVEIEWQPSGALPLSPGVVFFRVQRKGPYWSDVVGTSSLALYLPKEADWADTILSVYAVAPEHLR